jgi:hypothetical protein
MLSGNGVRVTSGLDDCSCLRAQGQILCGEDYKGKYEVLVTKMSFSVERISLFQTPELSGSRVPSWRVVVMFGAKDDPLPKSSSSANVMAQPYGAGASFVSIVAYRQISAAGITHG